MTNFSTPRVLLPVVTPIRKRWPGLKINLVFVGSFVSVRIEDPDGTVPYKTAKEIAHAAHDALVDAKAVGTSSERGDGYISNGIVFTWSRN